MEPPPEPENSGEEAGIDVAVAPDNGIVVLGNYRDGNIFLAKFNADGDLVWDLTWGSGQEGASAIDIAPDGTIYVTGVTFGFDLPQGDAFLLSFSSGGLLNWQRTWGGELLRRRPRRRGRDRREHLHHGRHGFRQLRLPREVRA